MEHACYLTNIFWRSTYLHQVIHFYFFSASQDIFDEMQRTPSHWRKIILDYIFGLILSYDRWWVYCICPSLRQTLKLNIWLQCYTFLPYVYFNYVKIKAVSIDSYEITNFPTAFWPTSHPSTHNIKFKSFRTVTRIFENTCELSKIQKKY